jgi:hypothetical protein
VVNEAGYEAEDLLREAHKYLGRKRYRQLEDACRPASLLQESINGMIDGLRRIPDEADRYAVAAYIINSIRVEAFPIKRSEDANS